MNKKKKKTIILLFAFIMMMACLWINHPIVYFVLLIVIFFGLLNIKVVNKNRFWAVNINNLKVIGRNYDTLIIGEPVNVKGIKDMGRTISITCPERSLFASTVIAYRLFSLLRPEGKLIITYSYKTTKDISSLDMHYIHNVTLLEMGYKRYKRLLPLLFNPIRSFKLLLDYQYKHIERATTKDTELCDFCKSRNINLEYYKVK